MNPPLLERLTLSEAERTALQAFVRKVQQRYPTQLVAIFLFGSRARRDAHSDSDMDLLVVVTETNMAIQQSIRHLAVEVWLEFGIYLSTRVWSEAHQRQHAALQTMFYRNLQRDAISVLP
jgi:uncharacterized protein